MPPEEMDWVGIAPDLVRVVRVTPGWSVLPPDAPVSVSFSSTISVTTASEPSPGFSSLTTLTSTLTNSNSHGPLASEMFLQSRFQAATNSELANGRSRGYTTR